MEQCTAPPTIHALLVLLRSIGVHISTIGRVDNAEVSKTLTLSLWRFSYAVLSVVVLLNPRP